MIVIVVEPGACRYGPFKNVLLPSWVSAFAKRSRLNKQQPRRRALAARQRRLGGTSTKAHLNFNVIIRNDSRGARRCRTPAERGPDWLVDGPEQAACRAPSGLF